MVKIKPFKGTRPPKQYAAEVASRPYDVLNSAEAKSEATERSLLHIIKPEIDFEPIADEHSQPVYDKAVENFRRWQSEGWLRQDPEEYYYIYAQTMEGRTQYGLAMCCHFEDYLSGAIKKHELTRPDKEEDRMIHVRNQKANIEPVFFAYPDDAEIDAIVADVVKNNAPEYDFTAADGFGHRLWVIRDRKTNDRITEIFAGIPALYVADGHHRTAAAARVGQECRANNPGHTGCEEYCYFLAVTFPAGQLRIIDYNRVVKDLNGLTPAELLEKLKESFTVEDKGTEEYRPAALHNFSMYLEGRWYSLTAKPGTYDDNDPIGVLDVTVLGTSFNVQAYADARTVEVDLLKGRVEVAAADGRRLSLLPDRQARFDRTSGQFESHPAVTALAADWINGRLSFVNTPFREILDKLQRHFNVRIEVSSEKAAHESFSGSIDLRLSLDEILRYIDVDRKYTWTTTDGTLRLSDRN